MEKSEYIVGLSLYNNLPPLYAPGPRVVAFTDGLGQPMTGIIKMHARDDAGTMYYVITATDGSGNYIVETERVSI